jgi:hypothetical protein
MIDAAVEPAPRAWEVRWSDDDGAAGFGLPASADLSAASALELRVAVPNGTSARFRVFIDDPNGTTDLGTVTVTGLPRTSSATKMLARDVRVSVEGLDADVLDAVNEVRLEPVSERGRVYVLDAWAWSPGLPADTEVALPRFDVSSVRIVEGDGPPRTELVRVAARGAITQPARLLVVIGDPYAPRPITRTVTVQPGATGFDVPIRITPDRRDDPLVRLQVVVKALSESVTGRYLGRVTIVDDDPAAKASVVAPAVTVREGRALVWTFRLDRASDRFPSAGFRAVEPKGTELRTVDLPQQIRDGCTDGSNRPLSATEFWCAWVQFQPGERTATFRLPTARDDRREGDEQVRFVLIDQSMDRAFPKGVTLTGTVRDR